MTKTLSWTWLLLIAIGVGILSVEGCTENQFQCKESESCISPSWVCDGSEDCEDGSDEAVCAPRTCSSEEFRCSGNTARNHSNGECIPKRWVCDGDHDCTDESDEDLSICKNRKCTENQFACPGGMCISKEWTCDEQWDCPGGEDEDSTICKVRKCGQDEFPCANNKCITLRWTCDRDNDCGDNSDEKNCPERTCGPTEFMCKNSSKCIPNRWHCDGDQDCHDNSDESDCPTSGTTDGPTCPDTDFTCLNHDCIHSSWRCDGDPDCLDGSDEHTCPVRTCASNQFMCADNKMCIPGFMQCDGTKECGDGSDEDCPNKKSSCNEKEEFDCTGDGSQCLPLKSVCDGKGDCLSHQDEAPGICNGTNPCSKDKGGCSHDCVHTYGKNYYCSCPPGYEIRPDKDNKTCEDIDECLRPGTCSQLCQNRKGSFKCECKDGYLLDRVYSKYEEGLPHSHRNITRYCRAIGSTPHLLFANRHDVRRFHLETGKYKSVVDQLRSAVSVDYDISTRMVYWSDVASEQIIRADIDNATSESSHQTLVESDARTPDGIAFDWVHKNLYWTDAGLNTLEVMAVDNNRYRKVLFTKNMDEPRAIVVDPREKQGFMYWTDWGENARIEKAGLDGKHRTTIVNTDIQWPNGITIDYADDRIYWIDAKLRAIASSNLQGLKRRVVLTSYSQVRHPFAITVFEDHLYWTDWETESIRKVNKFHGKSPENVVISLYSPMDIQVYHPVRQPTAANRCVGHVCSHMCLPSPYFNEKSSPYLCACPESHELQQDYKTCVPKEVETVSGTVKVPPPTATTVLNTHKHEPVTKGPLTTQPHDMGKIAAIVVGVLLLVIIVIAVVGCILYRSYTRKNMHSMNFDNPVYRKTTEDQFSLEKHQYQPSKSLPSTLEPLTSSNNELV